MKVNIISDGVVINTIEAVSVDDAQAIYPDCLVHDAALGGSVGDLWDGDGFVSPPAPPLVQRQKVAWEAIKAERERRRTMGVLVQGHWYHSDDASRIQQLALVLLGANVPAGLQWKTLTHTPPPVFVTMTSVLAQAVFQAQAASDVAIFQAAEAHRLAMEASDTPEDYDFTIGWPPCFEDGTP